MKIAFYAPMKSPLHPVPSGDRRMARLLMKAISEAGYEVELACEFRSFDKTGDLAYQAEMRKKGSVEADRLIAEYESGEGADRPDAWFTYHLYHKAPDWIGPHVAKALSIPYFVAEASHAPKRKNGPWSLGYEAAEKAIASADKVFHMTRLDGECLKQITPRPEQLVYLPPFLDVNQSDSSGEMLAAKIGDAGGKDACLTLLTVAMMRSGDKLVSYGQLAEALDHLSGDDWQLVIVGDGPEKAKVQALLTPHESRIIWLGELSSAELFALYEIADLYVWPASGEAYGMTFLEAGSCGLPAVSCQIRGVPDVVLDQKTGMLAPEGDLPQFASLIRDLLNEPDLREKLGREAKKFVLEERSLAKAASLLNRHFQEVMR